MLYDIYRESKMILNVQNENVAACCKVPAETFGNLEPYKPDTNVIHSYIPGVYNNFNRTWGCTVIPEQICTVQLKPDGIR